MKRWIALILILALLAGCAGTPPAETSAPTETTVATQAPTSAPTTVPPTEPSESLDPNDPIQVQTGGAICSYPMEREECTGITRMGRKLLLFYQNEGTRLVLLSETDCRMEAEAQLEAVLQPDSGSLQITGDTLAYCSQGSVIFLNKALQETKRVALPAEARENVVLAPDLKTVYYCQDSDIRAYDMETGLSRLLRRQKGADLMLLRCIFSGELLACYVTEPDSDSYTYFISTDNGESLGEDPTAWNFTTYEDRWFLQRINGSTTERLFGVRNGEARSLTLESREILVAMLAQNGVLTAISDDTGQTLRFYDLDSGRRIASQPLQGLAFPNVFYGDPQYIWFTTYDESFQEQRLYRWDIQKSAVQEDAVYTGPRYTADDPDDQGLAECRSLADRMGRKYGVTILLGREAAEVPCDYYSLEAEYQVEAFQTGLADLEKAISRYPQGFFQDTVGGLGGSELQIALVREISVEEDLAGVQFWANGKAYIVLRVNSFLEQTFYHELCHVLDTYIFSNSREYDDWEQLNPKGFTYDYNYTDYMNRPEEVYEKYLFGENQAFIDSYSMTYPNEDRARIMEYAMCEGMEIQFASKTMQKKLRKICVAMRDAFGWEKDAREFPWEMYLEESLVYQGR